MLSGGDSRSSALTWGEPGDPAAAIRPCRPLPHRYGSGRRSGAEGGSGGGRGARRTGAAPAGGGCPAGRGGAGSPSSPGRLCVERAGGFGPAPREGSALLRPRRGGSRRVPTAATCWKKPPRRSACATAVPEQQAPGHARMIVFSTFKMSRVLSPHRLTAHFPLRLLCSPLFYVTGLAQASLCAALANTYQFSPLPKHKFLFPAIICGLNGTLPYTI